MGVPTLDCDHRGGQTIAGDGGFGRDARDARSGFGHGNINAGVTGGLVSRWWALPAAGESRNVCRLAELSGHVMWVCGGPITVRSQTGSCSMQPAEQVAAGRLAVADKAWQERASFRVRSGHGPASSTLDLQTHRLDMALPDVHNASTRSQRRQRAGHSHASKTRPPLLETTTVASEHMTCWPEPAHMLSSVCSPLVGGAFLCLRTRNPERKGSVCASLSSQQPRR